MHPQRPAGRIIDAEDLHIAETDQQLTDTRRVLLHRGPPRNWCLSTPILEAPNPTIANPVPAHFRRAAKLRGLLRAGDPHGEVRLAWHAKETLRGLYDIDCPQLAERYATELADDLADADCPPELRRLGRTLAHWHTQIVNWHHARVSNRPKTHVFATPP